MTLIFEYGFASHYLSLSSGRLHYLDEGNGPVVVLVHGNPSWSYYYRNLVSVLSKKFRVIAPDHLGCGLSDKPQQYDYKLENHISNLGVLLEHLGVKNLSMVVHDWGGAIGLGAIALGYASLDRLVILNTAAFRSQRIPLRINVCRLPLFGKILVQGFNGFAGAAIFMAVEKKMNKKVAAGYLKPYDSWDNRRAIYEFVKDIPLQADHKSYQALVRIEDSLGNIAAKKTPVSILWGGRDFCFNDHFYDQWRYRFPLAEYCYFNNWGHYVLEDGRGKLEPIIEEFLSR